MRLSTLQLVAISQVDQFIVAPIVAPHQRKSFEAVANNYYKKDGNYPVGTGYSDFGPGIFDVAADGSHVKSPNHTDPLVAKHDFLIPLFTTSSNKTVDHLLSNSYADGTIQTVDDVFECFNTTVDSPSVRQHRCSTIMNFPVFRSNDLAALSTPIYPLRNPTEIVAFMVSLFSWQTLLAASTRQSFNFQCSIDSPDREGSMNYEVKNGEVKKIDRIHSTNTNEFFSKSLKKSYMINLDDLFVGTNTFTITYYSTQESSSTSQFLPLVALFSCLSLTMFVSVIFICFIVLLSRETFAAHRLLEAKRTYVRFISHEIRTPLNTIKLSIHLLSRNLLRFQDIINELSPRCSSELPLGSKTLNPLSEMTQILEESLELLVGLDENSSISVTTLNDLINYDKIETNSFRIEMKDVSIWPLIEKTVHPMFFLAKEKNIRMSHITQISDPSQFPESNDGNVKLQNLYVIGDSIKLEQVIRNVVSNALKFTPLDGEVKISAYFLPRQASNFISASRSNSRYTQITQTSEDDFSHLDGCVGSIVISVTDSGPGLSEEQQQSMFVEGVQFNPNELQAGQGSGLGLWISKEIVSRHHGSIQVSSEGLGLGSTFEIILPVFNRPDPTSTPESHFESNIPSEPSLVSLSLSSSISIPTSPILAPASSRSLEPTNANINPNANVNTNATMSTNTQDSGVLRENYEEDKMTLPPPRTPTTTLLGSDVLISPPPTINTPSQDHSAALALPPPPPPALPRVLVVDDTPSCRKIVSRLLKSKGFVCNEAENGEACVKMVQSGEHEFDMILMDFEMPVMNGPTAARKLREMKCDVLIVGLTGNVLPEDKEYFLNHGANVVLFKPLNIQDLLDYFQQYRSEEVKV